MIFPGKFLNTLRLVAGVFYIIIGLSMPVLSILAFSKDGVIDHSNPGLWVGLSGSFIGLYVGKTILDSYKHHQAEIIQQG